MPMMKAASFVEQKKKIVIELRRIKKIANKMLSYTMR